MGRCVCDRPHSHPHMQAPWTHLAPIAPQTCGTRCPTGPRCCLLPPWPSSTCSFPGGDGRGWSRVCCPGSALLLLQPPGQAGLQGTCDTYLVPDGQDDATCLPPVARGGHRLPACFRHRLSTHIGHCASHHPMPIKLAKLLLCRPDRSQGFLFVLRLIYFYWKRQPYKRAGETMIF